MNLVGIIPAAGKGTRLAPFPCAKELFPIGFQDYEVQGVIEKRPKVISQYILEAMLEAGVRRVMIILGQGKSDVMEFYGDGSRFGCEISYLYQERLNGMPSAINLARAWIGDATVVFGMPDTIIQPTNILKRMLASHHSSQAELSLGLFPTKTPHKFGMVEIDGDNVISTIDKPSNSQLEFMWGCCVWSKSFTDLINTYLAQHAGTAREIVLGDVFNLALQQDRRVKACPFVDGTYLDIGTAHELDAALGRFRLQDISTT